MVSQAAQPYATFSGQARSLKRGGISAVSLNGGGEIILFPYRFDIEPGLPASWVPAFAGKTEKGAGKTEEGARKTAESAGMTEEGARKTAEGAGMTAEDAGMTAEGAGMTEEGDGQPHN